MSAAEMREALKPCPFCGGEATYRADHTTECVDSISCRRCDFYMSDPDIAQGSVIAAWNRRALPDGEGMVERVVEKPDILRAAVEEYLLRHPSEGPDERISRAAAVRGMMVRLGLYSEFEPALARAAFQSAESRSKDGLCSDCPPQGYPTNETRCDECPRAALRALPLPDEEGMVERVARAMFDVEAEGEPWIVWDHTRSDYERLARAAIRAINGGEP